MVTIGQIDQSANETMMAKSKYRKVHVLYRPIEAEFLLINKTLDTVLQEVRRVAATYAEIPLALSLNEPDEHDFNTGRVVHSSLLLLEKTKDKISDNQWSQYNERYEKLVETYGAHRDKGVNRYTHFTPEMDKLVTSIGNYIQSNGVSAKRAFWKGEPSPRFLTTIAIIHAATWLQQQEKKSETES